MLCVVWFVVMNLVVTFLREIISREQYICMYILVPGCRYTYICAYVRVFMYGIVDIHLYSGMVLHTCMCNLLYSAGSPSAYNCSVYETCSNIK